MPQSAEPPGLRTNRDCLVCGQCIKSCEPDNMRLLVRRPFHPGDVREAQASWPVAAFVMLVSGFVTYELCTEWPAAKALFLLVPHLVGEWVGVPSLAGYIKALWMLVVVPLVVWTLLSAVTRLLGDGDTLSQVWRRAALPVAVVVSAGHMAKSIAKSASWGGFLPGAMREPGGVETVLALTNGTLARPGSLLPMSVVAGAGVVLLLAGLCLALREVGLADPRAGWARRVPVVVFALGYLTIVIGWAFP